MLEPTDGNPHPVASTADSFDWDELLVYLKHRRVIPIVGPEAMLVELDGKKLLVDEYLADRLAQALRVSLDELPGRPTVAAVAFNYLEREPRKQQRIYSELNDILEDKPPPVPDTLLKLAEIAGFELFISTTFDSLLVRALEKARGPSIYSFAYSPDKALEDLPSKAEGRRFVPAVYQLLGKASPLPDYAVTEEDTLEFLHALQSMHRPANLFDVLRENHLLLLGCRLPDWLARFFVRTMRRDRLLTTAKTREFVVDDTIRRDRNLVLFLKHYATEVYASTGVTEFVDELHRRWRASQPASKPGEAINRGLTLGKMPEGVIFLSYAREDQSAVMELKVALDEFGLDAWLDTEDIPPGTDWDARINDSIWRCSVFIPCLSQQAESRKEGYFRREWTAAIKRSEGIASSRRFIWPVALDEVAAEATDIPREFRGRQWVRFTDRDDRKRLLEQLQQEIRTIRR